MAELLLAWKAAEALKERANDKKQRAKIRTETLAKNKNVVPNPNEKAFEEKEIQQLKLFIQTHRPGQALEYIQSFTGWIPGMKPEYSDLLSFKKDTRNGLCKNCQWSCAMHYTVDILASGPMCPSTAKTLLKHLREKTNQISQELKELQRMSVPREPSKFFEVLAKHDAMDHVTMLLALLVPLITCAFELQLFFTIACAACRQKDSGVTERLRNKFLREGLLSAYTNRIIKSEDDLVFCQLALNKAASLGAFKDDSELLFDRLTFRYTAAAMENTTFVQELKALIQANSDSIAKLQNRVDAHESAITAVNRSLHEFKKAYRKQQRLETIGSFVKLVVGAFSFGTASALVDIFTSLQTVVDLSDFKSISILLQDSGVDFKAVDYLKDDAAQDAICGGLDHLAGRDLDKATSNHVCLKMLAVASASVGTEPCGNMQNDGPDRQESTGRAERRPQTPVKEGFRAWLEEHELEELGPLLAEAGFTNKKVLQRIAQEGKKEFVEKLQEANLKVGQIESLWDAFDTPPPPAAVTQAPPYPDVMPPPQAPPKAAIPPPQAPPKAAMPPPKAAMPPSGAPPTPPLQSGMQRTVPVGNRLTNANLIDKPVPDTWVETQDYTRDGPLKPGDLVFVKRSDGSTRFAEIMKKAGLFYRDVWEVVVTVTPTGAPDATRVEEAVMLGRPKPEAVAALASAAPGHGAPL